MEQSVEKLMDDVSSRDDVIGCILTDNTGLCLGVKGSVLSESAGVIAAIADLVSKIEPGSKAPVISLESKTRTCLINQLGSIMGAIFKDTST